MLYLVTLDNGRRIYKEEGSKVRCFNPSSSTHSLYDLDDCIGRMARYSKNIETTEVLDNIMGIDLDFDMGYAIGASIIRVYRKSEDGSAIVCFRDVEVRDRVLDIIEPIMEDSSVIRQGLRLSRRDEYWYKLRIKSKKFFSLIDKFKIEPRSKTSLWWAGLVPQQFKDGMFIGLFDSLGSFHVQKRSKYGKKDCYLCKIDVAKISTHAQVAKICNTVDVDFCESFCSHAGENRNKTTFRLWSVIENADIFRRLQTPKLKESIGKFLDDVDAVRRRGDRAPVFDGLQKIFKKFEGLKRRYFVKKNQGEFYCFRKEAVEFIEKHKLKKSEDPRVRRWAELFQPNFRWSQIKSVEAHFLPRY